ncbi:VMA21-like domain-containing protein [Calycina marina]|uniref:VMA21-like domain-containing protein n=1 Tax=Calycina marina TaxID=1763456 RepID=A0A9P8CGW9_9HELO|nr:VMA21-like domain-containing protein [Calycina marina]
MATRRNIMTEKSTAQNESPTTKSDIAPAVPAHVIYKLLGFTFAMAVIPISSYFATLNTVFGGNSTWAGATAAVLANAVLIGYVIVAFKEDQSEAVEAAENARKEL